MNEQQLQIIGFKEVDDYEHDQFRTRVFSKGALSVDLTFFKKSDELESASTFIDDGEPRKLTFAQLCQLDSILNCSTS